MYAMRGQDTGDEKPSQPDWDPKQANSPEYTARYIDNLYKQSDVANKELKELTESIAQQTGGEAKFRPGAKKLERVCEKLNSDYEGDASQIVDLSGSKIVYETLDDLYHALPVVERELGERLIRVKDRFIQPVDSGYGDILMNVRMSNGHVGEFRLHLRQVDEIADNVEHPLYQVQRSLKANAYIENRPLTLTEEAIEKAISEETRHLYLDAFANSQK